ncbi:MAG TPA: Stk1 family PASTA domain-containing Ser/Thr kinase [Mycobacteriales bacterium]|nr:Stk1 family PASTA domain-containing Ser/Thr kinase [Mycobacteriales bacterium]
MTDERTLLAGRYEIGETIGYGGMAEVHRGRDVRLGRDVAIKLLRRDLGRDPVVETRFRREAQSAASLNSPSIVAVYDTGEDNVAGMPTPYIVMEYVDGKTLREVLAEEGRLLPRRALEVTAAVCTALEQAHVAGIVHRDIKPANVMLTSNGDIKVMDFGIARALTTSTATMTQTAAVVGTAHYLSPEQARGEHVDARSDVYSTGCLLYELLTGAPPFTGDTAVAVAYQHVREDPAPPSSVEPDVPASVDAIVLVAMSKNPVNRYGSAAEMRADIERALAGKPVLAIPVARSDDTLVTPVPPTTVLMREQPHRKRGFAYVLLAIATLGVFVIALVAARSLLASSTADLNTPDVIHQTLADARSTLVGQGLVVGTVQYRYTGKSDANLVIDQNPPAGIFLHKGQAVDLVVSKGVRSVDVPNTLVGLTLSEAKSTLLGAGLKLGRIIPRNSSAPANQVLNSRPAAGTSVPAGSTVDLVVSTSRVKVPNVVGKDQATAEAILQQDGFNFVSRRSAVYTPGKIGQVVSQSPSSQTYAATGSTVVIYIDRKPKASTSPNPSTSTGPSGTPSTSPPSSP